MSRSRDKLGRGPWHSETCLIWSVPSCWIAKISAEQWAAAMGDEVAVHVDGVFPLPMGMEREDRYE